jgi:hypothetical protein
MENFEILTALHNRFDGPIPARERTIAENGSLREAERLRANAMTDRFALEYGRVLSEIWRHRAENAFLDRFRIEDRLRDIAFYRGQRVGWDRHARRLAANSSRKSFRP